MADKTEEVVDRPDDLENAAVVKNGIGFFLAGGATSIGVGYGLDLPPWVGACAGVAVIGFMLFAESGVERICFALRSK